MKNIATGALAAVLSAATALPLNAAPVFAPQSPQLQSDIQTVQARRGFYRHNGFGYYNGHRGYRHWRRGYREYNGWWFPAGAFIAGALITGAIANSSRANVGDAHVQWCFDHYRSYRVQDNSWQPTRGPRRQCNSPYD
jgi:hypothetical protein